jgi:hypothetical protein
MRMTKNNTRRVKVFRFPKGISTVHVPDFPPFGWDYVARDRIYKFVKKYSKFPKGAMCRFRYRYDGITGISEVTIYKDSTPRVTKRKK